ncbi:conserved hypothetical protein [Vibrio vulnificus YJ016]|jgi:hypothetical protein|uniref:WD40 repeat protein n=3 Tax=Vibrio vulnificus TaxID=672 RepID=A0A1V8MJU1_VIBVL|nr:MULTISPECIES: hypothetical protein [Vibrio]OJI55470.1 hypothetical protein VFL11327_03818 [Vibrio fluvialis]AAO10990.1 FOG: WD40 repeat protein [Vibrio vulnificus CMCP6]ALM70969.1 WD40 repeat protein [Vibrio vulnificus]ANH63225.1 hypothetical protein FORC16_1342 [Vibrio vulnificus]ANN26621.1 WD40 repeat [Vibrio vulnificus]
MKWLLTLLAALTLSSVYAQDTSTKSADLTYFDTPLLLGDWYLVNPNVEESREDFRAIKLTLNSKYEFQIDIQKRDYSIDHWEGIYTANEDTIILGLNTDEPQVYQYESNHNMLNLNGVTFTKGLPNALAGIWSSAQLSGEGMIANQINKMDLILQPDFVFMFRVTSEDGDESVKKGVYYTEGNHLVLLYENGEHDTTYVLDTDQLTLQEESGEMLAVLNRVR